MESKKKNDERILTMQANAQIETILFYPFDVTANYLYGGLLF